MGLPRNWPRAAPPCNHRMTAWAMPSGPCRKTTQTHREAEEVNGTEALRPLLRALLRTLLQSSLRSLLRCLINKCNRPQDRQTTTMRHLVGGQPPSSLMATYRGHIDSCRHQFTLIPRLTEASSRRPNFISMQTSGHQGHPIRPDTHQTAQQLWRRILDRLPSMTTTMRIHYTAVRLAARGLAEIQ